MDLLEAVGLFGNIGNFSVRHHGVVLRPGPHSSSPAAYFQSSLPEENALRKLRVNFKSDQLLGSLLQSRPAELTLVASLQQWPGNSGTLMALHLGGKR